MAQDPYRYFRLEARELLDQFSKGILELENGGKSADLVQRLLRYAHTLKGAARVVKQQEIADQAHLIEEVLSPFRDSPEAVPNDGLQRVLRCLDHIEKKVVALTPTVQSDVSAAKTETVEEATRTVRIDIADLDALLDGVSEAHALLNGLRIVARDLEPARRLADLLNAQLSSRGLADNVKYSQGVGTGTLDRANALADDLWKGLSTFERKLDSSINQMDREMRQLRDAAEQLRLVSVGSLLTTLERTARDAAQTLGKTITFVGTGGDMRLDAHVLGITQGALVQIIRNAVAHGIETAAERSAMGKSPTGLVAVDVVRQGRKIVFKCHDDGRGLDLEAVRRVAVQRGVLSRDAQSINSQELLRMLLGGGISTSQTITEMSGRGIGLDVVRASVRQLGGDVAVSSKPNQGTTFQLVVPPSLASMEALIIEANGVILTIPLDAVRSTLRMAADQISRTSSGTSVLYQDQAIPFIPLQKALDGKRQTSPQNWTTVVVSGAGGIAGIGVDRLLGTARIVVRPLPMSAPANTIVAGASLDAEGNPQLLLDPDGLIAEAQCGDSIQFDEKVTVRPVLVIDDSLTTRMLEQSILESAGYMVDVASSAEEGLEYASSKRYALFLVDVEMPGMDGFTFIERIRANPALHDIPAILITSRATPEDRQRGQKVGAQGYVVKSEFDQAKLLKMIKTMMG